MAVTGISRYVSKYTGSTIDDAIEKVSGIKSDSIEINRAIAFANDISNTGVTAENVGAATALLTSPGVAQGSILAASSSADPASWKAVGTGLAISGNSIVNAGVTKLGTATGDIGIGAGIYMMANTLTLKSASSTEIGGIKLGSSVTFTTTITSPSSVADRTYPVQQNIFGQTAVNVPWENTTYESLSAAKNSTVVSLVTCGEKYTWNNKSNFSGNYSDLAGKPTLATVATSGSYTDLSDKPTIPDCSPIDATSILDMTTEIGLVEGSIDTSNSVWQEILNNNIYALSTGYVSPIKCKYSGAFPNSAFSTKVVLYYTGYDKCPEGLASTANMDYYFKATVGGIFFTLIIRQYYVSSGSPGEMILQQKYRFTAAAGQGYKLSGDNLNMDLKYLPSTATAFSYIMYTPYSSHTFLDVMALEVDSEASTVSLELAAGKCLVNGVIHVPSSNSQQPEVLTLNASDQVILLSDCTFNQIF